MRYRPDLEELIVLPGHGIFRGGSATGHYRAAAGVPRIQRKASTSEFRQQ